MGLYKLFSCNVEIQYKSCFLSKAMLFTITTTLLNLIVPFIIAYRSRGFWLKSHNFYEQPTVHFAYEYLLVVETEDPSHVIACGDSFLDSHYSNTEENCAEMQVQEHDYNDDNKHDMLNFKFRLNIPPHRTVSCIILILALDFQLKTVCPLHMQSLAVINKEFSVAPSGLKYYGDLEFYQTTHLPCIRNTINTKYNSSLFGLQKENIGLNLVDFMLENYFSREAITKMKTIYSRSESGHTGSMDITVQLRVPEMNIRYIPSLLQELKWAWPQYLSLVVIFYWLFHKIKRFVFNNRLLMAWEVVPWKR